MKDVEDRKKVKQIKLNQEIYALIFKELLTKDLAACDVADLSGMHMLTAQSLMTCLKKHKVVHIIRWIKDKLGRDATPVYRLGEGFDMPRAKLTQAERQRRYKARQKARLAGTKEPTLRQLQLEENARKKRANAAIKMLMV